MPIRNIVTPALTWCALAGFYLTLTGQATTDEVIAAATTAAAGTAFSVLVRLGADHRFRLPPRIWLAPIGRALAALPRDVVSVGWHLLRPHPGAGQMATQPLPQAAGADKASNRAVQLLATSFAPNRYVITLVQGEHILTHQLAGASGHAVEPR
ncbi:MAG TPA: hypothetical protein VHO91_07600 [Rhodopila sp.]|nr:hypothetical protein [Rhodopila sp.]